jgi:hypothetical protein
MNNTVSPKQCRVKTDNPPCTTYRKALDWSNDITAALYTALESDFHVRQELENLCSLRSSKTDKDLFFKAKETLVLWKWIGEKILQVWQLIVAEIRIGIR